MDERERKQLIEDLVGRLRKEGAPEGAWLLDIEHARRCLEESDDVLRRLRDAIIASASGSSMLMAIASTGLLVG